MLHITTTSHLYSCHPKTKDELKKIIIERIKTDGPECDLNDIDVSDITDMSYLFDAALNLYVGRVFPNELFEDFNGDISQWDVSNVENMYAMFNCCKKFNGDISAWDVSNVVNMESMFFDCRNFRRNLDKWNISNVKYMHGAFFNCPIKPKWYKNRYKLCYI